VTRKNSLALFDAVGDIDCKVLVKPHGNSLDIPLWRELVSQQRNEKIRLVAHTADIFNLIAGSDLVVATFSTVVIEAMLFQKNVITLNFTSEPDIHPYAKHGIAYGVYHPDDLAGAIRRCLYDEATQADFDEARKREAKYFGGPFDGENTKRVADFVEQLSRGRTHAEGAEKCQSTIR
jgi:CDP-glycerol glycerophosphotransferase (TagB/SpsB family)